MKVNKEKLKALAELSDEALWQTIRETAKAKGYNLTEKPPSKAEMETIRSIMRGDEKINMAEALSLLKKHKNK